MSYGQHIDWDNYIAAIWRKNRNALKQITDVDLIDLDSLLGIDEQKALLCRNTERFLADKPANHCLLWGARGMGKSSLVKGILNLYQDQGLRVIEIPKDDLVNLIDITDEIRTIDKKFIVFCDDLSFDDGDSGYRALKSSLEGTFEKPPANILIYATSNRRHFVSEKMQDNVARQMIDGEIHESDVTEDKLSLADRFGLTLGFYPVYQKDYLQMIDYYFRNEAIETHTLYEDAINFATQRGIRSGRVARQFYMSRCKE
jgi:hypothetical protein